MKLIYLGSGDQKNSGFSNLKERKLVLNSATNNREKYVVNLLKNSLSNEIIYVSTAYGTKSGPFLSQTSKESNIEFVALGYWGNRLRRLITSLIASFIFIFLNVKKGDVVLTYNFPPVYGFPLLFKRFFTNFKIIINYEDFFNQGDWRKKIYDIFDRAGVKKANAFIAVSEGTKNFITNLRSEAKVIVNGGYHFRNEEITLQKNTNETGIITILYSGTLDAERGIKGLLDSFKGNNNEAFNIKFSGKGPLENEIIESSKSDKRIKYLGYLDDDIYKREVQNADVCICSQYSSISVNFPSKITSYLSQGKIVLCTKIPSLLESPYKDLLIFYDDEDPMAIWKALNWIRDNLEDLNDATQARIKIFSNLMSFQEEQMIKLIKSVFNEN